MNEDNDIQEVLSEARCGNRASMGRLAVIVRRRLYPFVFRTTLNHDLTEDVLQETLLTMVGQIACLRNKRRFWPWVFRIAWSKLQDNHRRRRHQVMARPSPRTGSGQAWPCIHGLLAHATDRTGSGNLLEATIHAERLQQLSDLIGQLSRQSRDILHLRYYEQLPYTKIAALTHTTPQKARARFHRAKKYLKARLKDDTRHGMTVCV
jgi:RNA polymerase sigma-70 factor (ECF subfamily)